MMNENNNETKNDNSETKKVALYSRVSTLNQDLERQTDKLKEFAEYKGFDFDLFSEKVSSVKERPQLEKIFRNLEEYDAVVVTNLDRLARDMSDLISRVEKMREEDTEFITVEQNIDTSSKEGELQLNILGAYADFERKVIRERLNEGFQEALSEGRVGRPRKIKGDALEDFKRWWSNGYGPSVIMALLESNHNIQVSNDTIYRTAEREGLK